MGKIKEVNEQELEEIIKNKKIVLIDFSASWCVPCKHLHRVLEEKILPKYENNPDIAIVQVDIDKNKNLSQALQVMSVPTIMFFYNGKHVVFQDGENEAEDRIVGFMPNIDKIIDTFLQQLTSGNPKGK